MPTNKSPQKTGRRQSSIQYAPKFFIPNGLREKFGRCWKRVVHVVVMHKTFFEKKIIQMHRSTRNCIVKKMIYCSCTKKTNGNELAQMKNCTLAIQHFLLSNDFDIFWGGQKRCSICQELLKT